MDQSQWSVVRQVLRQVTRSFPKLKYAVYSDYLIACLHFWGVLHERPTTWTLDRSHHTRQFRPRELPSLSQLNRRIASTRFQSLLQQVHQRLAGNSRFKGLLIDGQALCVGGVSKDRDARRGHIPGGFGKGYKLHVVVTSSGEIAVFSVLPLNTHELPVAQQMLASLKHDLNGVLVMADGNYDAAAFHKQISAMGGFLITAPRGHGKHPVTQRQMGPARRQLLDLWQHHPRLMKNVYHHRKAVERRLANLSTIPGLLTSLPKFIRGLPRVRRFVGSKICLYHAHRLAKQANAEQS